LYSIIRIVEIKNTKVRKIEEILSKNEYPAYRLKQLVKNIYCSPAESYEKMTDLPAGLRFLLTNEGPKIMSLQLVTQEHTLDS